MIYDICLKCQSFVFLWRTYPLKKNDDFYLSCEVRFSKHKIKYLMKDSKRHRKKELMKDSVESTVQ